MSRDICVYFYVFELPFIWHKNGYIEKVAKQQGTSI